MRVRFLEPAKVHDKENVKSAPVFEVQAGTDAKMLKAYLKAWKLWNEILFPDGRIGVVPADAKLLKFGLGNLAEKEITLFSTPSFQSEIKSRYKFNDYIYVQDYVNSDDGNWVLVNDLFGNEGYIKGDTVVNFLVPVLVTLTQDKVLVFSFPSTQSDVIMELRKYDCFYSMPVHIGNIITDAQWRLVENLSGNHGFIKDDTQISMNIDEKTKVFSQFLSQINSGLAFQDEKPLDRINEYKEELVEHIKSNKDCFSVINYFEYAGADWLLQPNMVDDSTVQFISKRACGKAPAFKFDDRGKATVALIAIEIARKNGLLVPDIIQAYRTHSMAEISALAKITWDNRIVDFLIEQLNQGFRWQDNENSSLWVWNYKAGSAQKAAEALIEIGDEKGVNEIVPHVLKFVIQHNNSNISGQMESWCVYYGETLSENLVKGLFHQNAYARLFIVKCLAQIGNPKYVEALSNLSNDPDAGVRDAVKNALNQME